MHTGRRSFLSVALAWLAGVVALLWPFRGLARAARTGGFTPPTRPADPDALIVPKDVVTVHGSVDRFTDLGPMLDELFEHLCKTGHMCLNADDPRQRTLGFSTFGPPDKDGDEHARLWEISLTAAVRSIKGWKRGEGLPKSLSASADVNVLIEAFKADCRVFTSAVHSAAQARRASLGLPDWDALWQQSRALRQ